jgi:hypothetical protein
MICSGNGSILSPSLPGASVRTQTTIMPALPQRCHRVAWEILICQDSHKLDPGQFEGIDSLCPQNGAGVAQTSLDVFASGQDSFAGLFVPSLG